MPPLTIHQRRAAVNQMCNPMDVSIEAVNHCFQCRGDCTSVTCVVHSSWNEGQSHARTRTPPSGWDAAGRLFDYTGMSEASVTLTQ